MGYEIIIIVLGIIFSPFIYLFITKGANSKDFLIPLIIYFIAGLLSYFSFNKAYSNKKIEHFAEIKGADMWGNLYHDLEPVYSGENYGHYVLLFLPVILLVLVLVLKSQNRKSMLFKSLTLLPLYLIFSYLIFALSIEDWDKPSYSCIYEKVICQDIMEKYTIIPEKE